MASWEGVLGVGTHVLFDVPFSYFVQLSRLDAQPGGRNGAAWEHCLSLTVLGKPVGVTDVCPTTIPRTISEAPALSL